MKTSFHFLTLLRKMEMWGMGCFNCKQNWLRPQIRSSWFSSYAGHCMEEDHEWVGYLSDTEHNVIERKAWVLRVWHKFCLSSTSNKICLDQLIWSLIINNISFTLTCMFHTVDIFLHYCVVRLQDCFMTFSKVEYKNIKASSKNVKDNKESKRAASNKKQTKSGGSSLL